MKKQQENLIHVKLNYEEAVQSKKDVLNTEVDLIKIAKAIQNYKKLRSQELILKLELLKKIKGFKSDERKLKHLLPKLEIPKIIKKIEAEKEAREKELKKKMKKIKGKKGEKTSKKKETKKKEVKKTQINSLDQALKEIQEKLAKLD